MQIACPSCRHPIPIKHAADTDDAAGLMSTIASIECPNCGPVPLSGSCDDTMTFVRSTEEKPVDVAHFELIRPLGSGSFGTVWLARDTNLEREVALKLPGGMQPDLDSLLHEARTAATLHHPNIVSVHEVGGHDGQVFIASEYIDGLTLRDSLTAGKPSYQRAAEIAHTIADALQHAHSQGVIHRDIKPANILMRRNGQPCITDFGLARRLSSEQSISANGQILGTARYMAPEQALGRTRETDQRADVYALGVVLFEMLTGELPFRGNLEAVLHQKTDQDPPSPRTLDTAIPRDLETICLRCLAREPERRYQSAQDVADELRRFLAGEPILARAISRLERAWMWCRRRPAIAGLTAALFLSLTCGLCGVSLFWLQAEQAAETNRQSLYRSQMNLAAEYAARGDLNGLAQTLDRYKPDGQLTDLRGFEWYYHARLRAMFTAAWIQDAPVTGLALSKDGRLAAALGNDRRISVCNTADGSVLAELSIDVGEFRAVAFSPTHEWLASGSNDGMLRVWHPRTGVQPRLEIKHGPPVVFVQFSPDGRWLLSAGKHGALRIWDAASGERIAEFAAGEGETRDVKFSPDGNSIAVAKEDDRVRIMAADSGRISGQLQPCPKVDVLAWSPDGTSIATCGFAGIVRLWSVQNADVTAEIETGQGMAGGLHFIGNHQIALVAVTGNLLVIDITTQLPVFHADTHSLSNGVLSRSLDGNTFAVGSGDGSIKVLPLSTLQGRDWFQHSSDVRLTALVDKGRSLVTADSSGTVTVWNLSDSKSRNLAIVNPTTLRTAAIQPDGTLLAMAGQPGGIWIHDWRADAAVASINSPAGDVTALLFTTDGKSLLVGHRGGTVSCYSIGDWSAPRFELTGPGADINSLAESPDGMTVAIACGNNTLRLMVAASGILKPVTITFASEPVAVAFCDRGRSIAVGTASGELQFWSSDGAVLQRAVKGHTGRINRLVAFPGGATIVTAGRDRVLRLWDAATGERLTTLRGHGRQIFSLDVSPDGHTIVSGSLAGDARIWRGR